MHRLSSLLFAKNSLSSVFSYGYGQKVLSALVKHVYGQTIVAMIASLFCASIVVISLYDTEKNNIEVLSWAAFFLVITL
jgi:hypothetical protein